MYQNYPECIDWPGCIDSGTKRIPGMATPQLKLLGTLHISICKLPFNSFRFTSFYYCLSPSVSGLLSHKNIHKHTRAASEDPPKISKPSQAEGEAQGKREAWAVILQPINPLRQPINPSKAKASTTTHPSISLLLAGSKALKRPLVRKPMGHPLGLNPAGVLLFRNRALGGAAESTVLLRATAKASTPFHPHPSIHPSLFAFSWFEGAETAPGPQTNGPPLGRESCWGSAVSQPWCRRCFCSQIHGVAQSRGPIHPSIHPSLCFYSWFEGAETAPGPQTNGPPLGPESCWGSAVPQPCPGRCFCSRIHGAAHSGCAMLSMAVSTVLFRQLNPQCCSGPLYFNPSTHYVNPSTHPRPKLPPPPTHPSLCF